MFDQYLRIPKEKIMEPLARGPLRSISPNAISVSACAVSVGAGVAAWQGQNGLSLGLWYLNRFLDGLDGTVARVNHKQSDFGGYLDIVLDMVAYVSIPLGLAFASKDLTVFITLTLLFASFYINSAAWMMLAANLEKRNIGAKTRGELTSVTMPTAIIEGGEAVIIYSLFLIFPGWLPYLFGLLAILVLLSAGKQVIWAYRNMDKRKQS
ncbi:MAG: CDP-alcohol phosphatidyltransferase [Chloroflexi bacterium HGW-Chloroflexi-3]|nr:MAG: CDP-alcohol phosphatidyltransferase [Chloroflexi bacterium HGW-Chloroflexi-3]